MIPNDARRHLYGYQVICENLGSPSYEDVVWNLRYPDPPPKSTGAWPFQRVAHAQAENVTALKGRRKS